MHRHILCRTGQQPLQACPEGACRSFVFTKDDMGESQNAWVSYPVSISILALPMKESENMRTEQIKQMVMSRYDRFAETGGKQEEC